MHHLFPFRLPFDARSLNELKNKIIMGSFLPLTPNAPYSAGLVAVCHALLSKDPRKRPTCAAILNSREAARWLHTIPEPVRMPLPPLDAGQSRLQGAHRTAHSLERAAGPGQNSLAQPCMVVYGVHRVIGSWGTAGLLEVLWNGLLCAVVGSLIVWFTPWGS